MYSTISVEGLNALLWTLTALAILLSLGRFTIRYATARRFYWDDASHLLSVLLLIGLASAYTHGFPYSARIARIGLKKEKPPPLTDPFYHKYLQLRLTVTLLVFLVLWSVKMTFLIFYRLLFDVSRTFIRLWWAAVALTFATFWVCIGSTFTLCGSASDLYDFKKCSSPKAMHDIRTTYKYWCAMNVGTDLVVMILPLFMIYRLQLRTSQKAVLGGVFSLGFVVAIFDILRTVESLQSGTFSGVALWSSLEVTIAVIVGSLPLYRTLISSKGRRSLLSQLSGDRYKTMERSPASTERKFLENKHLHNKPSISTYRNDLETQDLEDWKDDSRGRQLQLPTTSATILSLVSAGSFGSCLTPRASEITQKYELSTQ
ncbi:MAG: hypothetical protein LQ352_008083 [Teloschistes flavicans]|nr:MAG: hypothetical protein LQ352_008083 [Teloschistes flavicans]